MARYVVRFMKDILGENGRQAEICQSLLEIEAANSGDATELAKKKFCEKQRVKEWSLHADRVQVAETEFPS
ncbi:MULTISPECIES: hypothetical protein [Rhodopseudomonas]|uniref:Uncharacterized protein n=1 Tax=Rhodopseudomonas palustris TaxID=1076 RepID=A0A0D7EA21_RHOPL|nr:MULTISPECIES: hypothetical protein [Rhodopseudomonas]KIZ37593.1 hypothetical protein OO17_23485 [Rhodopseudomonas palustris]MDF3811194.1 hypothetical protein [Rhodopseudomonas sp. BAL398]WOK18640.1 hypothetical protein RBJ75_03680 [Rhodopseudomonas sp. BAL398]